MKVKYKYYILSFISKYYSKLKESIFRFLFLMIYLLLNQVPNICFSNPSNGIQKIFGNSHMNDALKNTNELFQLIKQFNKSPGEIVIPKGIYVIKSVTVPVNVSLKFDSGAVINVNSTADTLKIYGKILSDSNQKIFTGDGEVLFLNSINRIIRTEWFGAVGDNSLNNTHIFQKAINSFGFKGGTIKIGDGIFIYDSLIVRKNCILEGQGKGKTILKRKYRNGIGGFGIKIIGSNSTLKNLSVAGKWNPETPLKTTYDVNISIEGNNTRNIVIDNVESYNSHIGFLMGGIIGRNGYYGQDSVKFINCIGHDTYDNNFSICGLDSLHYSVGTKLLNCVGIRSYSSANFEIRFQKYVEIESCYATEARNDRMGAGLRFEETSDITVSGYKANKCYFGIQFIHNSQNITIANPIITNCAIGVLLRSTQNILLSNVKIDTMDLYGIRLDNERNWSFYNKNVRLKGGEITSCGNTGILVVGKSEHVSDILNGSELEIHDLFIKNSKISGIFIKSGTNFSIANSMLQDNNVGVLIEHPEINNKEYVQYPWGKLENLTFITTGKQPIPYNIFNKTKESKLVKKSLFHFIDLKK